MNKIQLQLFAIFFFYCQSAIAQAEKMHLQACINLEYANILASAPPGLSTEDAFKHGYSQSDFIEYYEKRLRLLPNPQVEVPQMLEIAQAAGIRMANNLSKDQIARGIDRCRSKNTQGSTLQGATPQSSAPQDSASTNIFRDRSGEGVDIRDVIKCQFSPPTPDGSVVMFAPTDRGNLAQIYQEGRSSGKTSIYRYVGESDSKIYRVYKTGSVLVATHRTKPAAIMIYGESQFSGGCNALIPRNF